MLNLRKVAITGGLSCGKSSVCHLLKELGASVVSADKIVHQLLSSDTNPGQEVIQLLGKSILLPDGKFDRSRIARIVFQKPKLLQELEKIIHPAVYNEIEQIYQKQQSSTNPPPLFIAEIALLFESGGEKNYDATVAVIANPEICFQRFTKKTGQGREEFNNRVARQLPLLEKALRANYVIMNSGSLSNLEETTKELYLELIE
jgi:dephospho-CoA kinase